MGKWLLLPAFALLIGAASFWAWAEKPPPAIPDEVERRKLAEELRGAKSHTQVPPDWEARARKLGINPEVGRQELRAKGEEVKYPNGPHVWALAVMKPFQERTQSLDRYENTLQWRIPVCIAAAAVALLLVALAFREAKPVTSDARASVSDPTGRAGASDGMPPA